MPAEWPYRRHCGHGDNKTDREERQRVTTLTDSCPCCEQKHGVIGMTRVYFLPGAEHCLGGRRSVLASFWRLFADLPSGGTVGSGVQSAVVPEGLEMASLWLPNKRTITSPSSRTALYP